MSRSSPQPQPPTKAWYRQFWPWFIIAIPASSVVAGMFMIYLASSFDNELLDRAYYDKGLEINTLLARESNAAAAGLSATLSISAQGQVQVFLQGQQQAKFLTLALSSVSGNQPDLSVELMPRHRQLFEGLIEVPAAGRYHLILEPDDAGWRLKGSMTLPHEGPLQLAAKAGD